MGADSPRPFRWNALFQRAGEAVFILDRRRRVLFVNTAWEQLTGLSADRARGMHCRRPRPPAVDGSVEDALAHILTPPPDALKGKFSRARRIFYPKPVESSPSGSPALPPDRWDVEFLPLRQSGSHEGWFIVGRIIPLPAEEQPPTPPVPERLLDLRQRWTSGHTFDLLASGRPAMHRVLRQARLASAVGEPVLLVGERGSGKETVARIIHYQSPLKERSFASIDCRALPSSMAAGVLFAEPGSACPALGAIYLKEPSALPRDVQLRLCEWITTCAEKPGSFRLLAGCTQPEEEVRAGRLLEELFYLLGPLPISVPPLRERKEDLPALIENIVTALNTQRQREIFGLTSAAWEIVRHHQWPGNLNELRQVLAGAHQRTTGQRIDSCDLPAALRQEHRLDQDPPLRAPSRPLQLEQTLEQVERRLIQLALRRARGNRSLAAELLGIYRGRLQRRMEALGIQIVEGNNEEPAGP